MNRQVVLIEGCRTPFLKMGSDYRELMSYQLAAHAIKGLIDRTGVAPAAVDQVVLGTVVHSVRTPNVAREAALTAGLPDRTPCHSVSQACISANQAICQAVDLIRLGHAEMVIAGGTDSASDLPILFTKAMRRKLLAAQKVRTFSERLRLALSFRPADFLPERPAVAELLTGRLMGEDADQLGARFGVTRQAQDRFALRSHTLAERATASGQLAAEITPVELPPKFATIATDNGIRVAPPDKLASLRPAFVKPHGTITAANASFLTDGAAVVLLTTAEKAEQLGLTPKAAIRDYLFTGQDIRQQLLLGPAYAISRLLARLELTLNQIDVFELHEAFAAQVLANLTALADASFCQQQLGQDGPVGEIPIERLNLWGGSLSIGHPFGATGARLMTTTANRLIAEQGRYGLLAACAAGAHGHAMLLERV